MRSWLRDFTEFLVNWTLKLYCSGADAGWRLKLFLGLSLLLLTVWICWPLFHRSACQGGSGGSAGYLPLWVAAPGVNVSRGGEHQSVFSPHSHILDVDPRQSRDLLGPVVVPGSAFWQTNQSICDRRGKKRHVKGRKQRKRSKNELYCENTAAVLHNYEHEEADLPKRNYQYSIYHY